MKIVGEVVYEASDLYGMHPGYGYVDPTVLTACSVCMKEERKDVLV